MGMKNLRNKSYMGPTLFYSFLGMFHISGSVYEYGRPSWDLSLAGLFVFRWNINNCTIASP